MENHEAAAKAFSEATEQEFSFAIAPYGTCEAFRLLEAKDGDPSWAKRARNAYQVALGCPIKFRKLFLASDS